MTEREVTVIKFEPALTCAKIYDSEVCGKPADVAAVITEPGLDLGKCMEWPPSGLVKLMVPVCADCTKREMRLFARVYMDA